ncbi:MAG: hypothetical protein V7K14_00175 [Nostoc sp.]|uniref:hypothetical protein n=1 Tax=Nostoc sp. TaxID=1180 RepID=UPI002FF8B4C0
MTKQLISSLHKYRHNIYSQNGEDGVIEEVMKRLEINSGWFCEFGAWDGKHLSNTFHLAEQGWKGVYIEGDIDRFKDLQTNSEKYKDRLHLIREYVTPSGASSLDNLLSITTIPKDFELLSIDIDSDDYNVWAGLEYYSPLVVIIEIIGSIPPDIEKISTLSSPHSSFKSTVSLGKEKGYQLIGMIGNLFFVRDDMVEKLNLPNTELMDSSSLFDPSWLEASVSKTILSSLKSKFSKMLKV